MSMSHPSHIAACALSSQHLAWLRLRCWHNGINVGNASRSITRRSAPRARRATRGRNRAMTRTSWRISTLACTRYVCQRQRRGAGGNSGASRIDCAHQ